MKATRFLRFIAQWLGLTVASLLLFWLLWLVIGKNDVGEEESFADTIVFDAAYCAVVSLGVMAVCSTVLKCLSRWIEKRWAFLAASVGSLILNILMVHLLELAIDCLAGIPSDDPEQTEGLYICAVIATMLSILLLSNEHYRLYTEQFNARLLGEKTVLKQRLDIEELQKALEKVSAEKQPTIEVETLLSQLGIAQRQYRSRFLVPVFDGMAVLDTKEISHITIEGERLMAYLNDGKSVRLEETSLDIVEKMLDPADFFRANRQYIINIKSIARLSNFFNQTKILHLRAFPQLEIKISKERYSQLREWINQ